jgi:hypothetical protein
MCCLAFNFWNSHFRMPVFRRNKNVPKWKIKLQCFLKAE